MTDPMKWANALSTLPSLEAAIQDVVDNATQQLNAPADLAIVFISSAYASEFPRLMPLLRNYLDVATIVGGSGGGVIGQASTRDAAQEVEGEAALSLTLAHLPGVKVEAFHLDSELLPDPDAAPDAWVDLVGVSPADQPQFVLLSEPFAPGINDLLQGLDFAYPGSVKIGGLASTGSVTGQCGLFCNYEFYDEGIVGLALSGNIVIDAIVAQGCRPIGCPYRVVQGERNIVLELEADEMAGVCEVGKTPLETLQMLIRDLSEDDQMLAQNSLFIGIAQNEFKEKLGQGDFLIRNLIGVDPKVGAIAIGDRVRPGQRVQFHLRDAQTSIDDMEGLFTQYQNQDHQGSSPIGALLFACLGRGEGLYGQPNVDSRLFHRYLVDTPLSGFFCNGEVGPVGNTTFLHGYTSVFGICRSPDPSR
ncbi:FIST N-terminal domain-containing protein [Leptolyngbya sp. CCY15150]|uniref:FIST signal transduction protein n=1 Tax=Leptolyngbya sp. CCY15150 TaxID=2767772 RepID=UPI0031B9F7DD